MVNIKRHVVRSKVLSTGCARRKSKTGENGFKFFNADCRQKVNDTVESGTACARGIYRHSSIVKSKKKNAGPLRYAVGGIFRISLVD